MYKAEELVQRAKFSKDPTERNAFLDDSFGFYSRAASDMRIEKLQAVSRQYRELDYLIGEFFLGQLCKDEEAHQVQVR